MGEAFQKHFQNWFTKEFDWLSTTEAAICENEITEGEVHEALKTVDSGNSPSLDGLFYEFYLKLSHFFRVDFTMVLNSSL